MLEDYKKHCKEREEMGIPPLPLSAEQTADVVNLLKKEHQDSELLLHLLKERVPAGVDDAAYVKAGFLSDLTKGETESPYRFLLHIYNQFGTLPHAFFLSIKIVKSFTTFINFFSLIKEVKKSIFESLRIFLDLNCENGDIYAPIKICKTIKTIEKYKILFRNFILLIPFIQKIESSFFFS